MSRWGHPERLGFFIALTAAILFGISTSAVRPVYAAGGNAAFVMITTTWVRALSMTFYCLFTRRLLFQSREDIKQGLIGGCFQAFSAYASLLSLSLLSGPLFIIILFTYTLILLLFLIWKGEAKADSLTLLTTITALAGLSLALDVWQKKSTGQLWGIGLAFAAALATASRMYVYGHQTRQRHPTVVGAENFLVAALLTLLLFFKAPHAPVSFHGYGWALLIWICGGGAMFITFHGISLIGSFRWSLFTKMEPLFTTLFSAWFIHDALKPHQYVGFGIVLGSLVLYQTINRPHPIATAEAEGP